MRPRLIATVTAPVRSPTPSFDRMCRTCTLTVASVRPITPAISLFVDCESAAELDRLAADLGEGGSVMMPLDAYDFARRFTWLADRFGVSWQLRLA